MSWAVIWALARRGLGWAAGNLPTVALIAAALLALWFRAQAELAETRLAKARSEAALARESAARTVAAYEHLQKAEAAARAALEENHKRALARASSLAAALEEVKNAPASEDGPVAPVLERALERLRGNAAAP